MNFTDPFFVPPVVVVTPKRSYNSSPLSAESGCDAIATWVEVIQLYYFYRCPVKQLIKKVGTTAIMSKSLKTIRLSLIFQTCFDGTSVIVSATVKITSVWLHNIAITSIRT